MVQELLDLISKVDNVEDMDVIMYHVRRRQLILVNQEKYKLRTTISNNQY